MVSTTTTTTTNAAGQPTSSSNPHHPLQTQQQQQQQQPAATTLGSSAQTASLTANNSNYQRSASHQQSFYYPSSSTALSSSSAALATTHKTKSYYNSLTLNGDGEGNGDGGVGGSSYNNNSSRNRNTTKTATLSGAANSLGQEHIIAAGHNSLRYNKSRRPSSLYNGSVSFGGGDDEKAGNSSDARTTTKTPAADKTADVLETNAITKSPTNSIATAAPASSATTTPTVSLSEALLSTSPPLLNDQISLLFPKCRPRQFSPNSSNVNNALFSRSSNDEPNISQNQSNFESAQVQDKRTEPNDEEHERRGVTSTFERERGVKSEFEHQRGANTPVKYSDEYDRRACSPPPNKYDERDVSGAYDRRELYSESTVDIKATASPQTKTKTVTQSPPTPTPKTGTTTNYYRSVNIITQSPPPPSTSSVSSESLSSVTPRISTNPFLSHTDSVEDTNIQARAATSAQHKYSIADDKSALSARRMRGDKRGTSQYRNRHTIIGDSEVNDGREDLLENVNNDEEGDDLSTKNKELVEDEDLPVPTYPTTFYYHTETTNNNNNNSKHTQSQVRQRQHQPTGGDSSNSYEMPRKRASYGGSGATHHHAQQPYTHYTASSAATQQLKQSIGQSSISVGNLNPNPFIKDGNYWDAVRQGSTIGASISANFIDNRTEHEPNLPPNYDDVNVAESNTTATATAVMSSASATAPISASASMSSIRRLYHQQQPYAHTGANGIPPRQQQQPQQAQQPQQPQPHISRLGRNTSELAGTGEQFVDTAIKRIYHQKQQQQQQQQQNSLQAVQNSCAEGLTPLATQYLYGSKTSLELPQQQQQPQPQSQQQNVIDNSILVERELKERDREQREQRKALAAYNEWEREREREREREWKALRENEHEREREMHIGKERNRDIVSDRGRAERENELDTGDNDRGERDRQYERQPTRRRDSYVDGSQQYQSLKSRNSVKSISKRNDNKNGVHTPVGNGEVEVFDDMTESWQNLRVTTDTSAPTMPTAATRQHFQHQQQLQLQQQELQQQQQQEQQQQLQEQQQQHHRQPTSLTLVAEDHHDADGEENNKGEEYIEQAIVNNKNNHLDNVEVTGSYNTNNNSTSIMYKDHPKRYLDRSGYTINAVETRHGIIEYEGSPRRIGGQTVGSMPTAVAIDGAEEVRNEYENEKEVELAKEQEYAVGADEEVNVDVDLTIQPNSPYVTKSAAAAANSNTITTTATTTTHNSPQQQYPARPGFPQRIISPPRECTPPIMQLSHNNSKQQQQQQQLHQQQQQQQQQQEYQQLQHQRQSSPPTAYTLDNNAEDTSNDVSEIGTISDLTTPDAISTTGGLTTTPLYTNDSPPVNASQQNVTTTTSTITMPPPQPTNASGMGCKPMTTFGSSAFSIPTKSSTFDYLYEFSETRKVLEEFFKCPSIDDRPIEHGSDVDSIDIQYEFHSNLDRNNEDDLGSPCNMNADEEEDDDVGEEDDDDEDDDDDDDDGLMGVDMDGIQPQQQHNTHHQQLQQQHNNQMRQLQTTLQQQQRNGQRETQIHTQVSPIAAATTTTTQTQYRQQQQQQHETYLQQQQQQQQQQSLQRIQTQDQQSEQRTNSNRMRSQRQQQQQQQQQQPLNNSSNNSISNNSNIYNNSSHSHSHHRRRFTASPLMRDFDFFLDSASRSSGEQLDQQDGVNHNNQVDGTPGTYRYSPETTDYDSNCGDLDSLSGEINGVSTSCSNYTKYYASSMPVLEDGLSSGHTSDTENNNQNNLNSNLQQPSAAIHHNPIGSGGISILMDMKRLSTNNSINSMNNLTISTTDGGGGGGGVGGGGNLEPRHNSMSSNILLETNYMRRNESPTSIGPGGGMHHEDSGRDSVRSSAKRDGRERELLGQSPTNITSNNKVFKNIDPELDSLYSISIFHRPDMVQMTPPPPAPAPHRKPNILSPETEILQPTPYKDISHAAVIVPPSATSPINALSTSTGTTGTGSGITSVASAISTTLNRNKIHQNSSSNSSVVGGIVPTSGGLTHNTLQRTNNPTHVQTQQQLPAPQQPPPTLPPSSSSVSLSAQSVVPAHTQIQSQSQPLSLSQSQSQPPPIPERTMPPRTPSPVLNSPVWMPRHLDASASKSLLPSSSSLSPVHHRDSKNMSADEDDVDTDLETDRLLGHQRLDDQGYYDENKSWESRKPRSSLLSKISPKQQMASTKTRNGYNALLSTTPEIPPPPIPPKNSTNKLLDIGGSMSSSEHSDKSPLKSIDVQDCVGGTMGSPGGSDGSACISGNSKKEHDLSATINSNGLTHGSGGGVGGTGSVSGGVGSGGTGNVNGGIGGVAGNGVVGHNNSTGSNSTSGEKKVKKSKNKEGGAVLIEGVLFRAKYLGSTQLVCEGQPTKSTRMMQAEEAVSRIKAPDGDVQPSTEVDLFISTEKIMVLNTDLKEIMMDHALRTISYIADIGDLVVLMARRRFVPQDIDDAPKPNRTPKMICHVFESDEAQFIAQSIGQAFQVAYMEFLKANGIEDHSFVKEMDYQEVLNSQEIFGDELEIFAKKELQKEVVVPKAKGEILGVVIVESGWGSMLPTVVIANLMSSGAAARCGQLNIGDQLIAINGLSLVGLPLSTCQTYIKNTKNQTVVKFTVVPCAPVVEVKIKRPNTKYQLGFSVQNGVICSLLRGGIAERGGVRVGHRIIEINNQSVVAVPHEKIVNLLATSVGEILMKTMPTSMFRLLTGQENPIYI